MKLLLQIVSKLSQWNNFSTIHVSKSMMAVPDLLDHREVRYPNSRKNGTAQCQKNVLIEGETNLLLSNKVCSQVLTFNKIG